MIRLDRLVSASEWKYVSIAPLGVFAKRESLYGDVYYSGC